ncbi:MAG: septal ring lytic transglycosylase RlpA family protein [Flavobacteriales bacterium AspAUS03]
MIKKLYSFILVLGLSIGFSVGQHKTKRKKKFKVTQVVKKKGKASWYGPGFHGRKTANGQIFDMRKFTAAHKTLPFGTKLKVTNPKNGKTVTVTINDRGPRPKGRILDLSQAAFKAIASNDRGVIQVQYEKVL